MCYCNHPPALTTAATGQSLEQLTLPELPAAALTAPLHADILSPMQPSKEDPATLNLGRSLSSSASVGQSAPTPAATPNMLEPLGMRMRAPYKDAIKKIFEEIAVFLSSPRAQTTRPESLDKLAKGYAELCRISNGNNLENIFAPIATLAPEYLGVPDVNGLLPGDYEISSPDAEVGCPVLAVTDEQLEEMRSSG